MLSLGQHQQYRDQGFVVVPAFKSNDEIEELRARAQEIVAAYDGKAPSIFTTGGSSERGDAYFMESAEAVHCFFEPDGRTINKIGHAMHDLDPVFERFSHDRRLGSIAKQIGMQQPLIYQSMYIFKQPMVGGEVDWHQDAAFFETEPQSVTSFWFALEDADRSNGCLWVQPGGHRSPLRQRYIASNGKARLQDLDSTPWPTLNESVALEVKRGALVVFNGMLPHFSAQNLSRRSRHAYTLHVVDGTSTYSTRNWLQRKKIPPRGFA